MKTLQQVVEEKQVTGNVASSAARVVVETFFNKNENEKMFEITNAKTEELFPSCKGKKTQMRYNYRRNFARSFKGGNGNGDIGLKVGNLWAIVRVTRCDAAEKKYIAEVNELNAVSESTKK